MKSPEGLRQHAGTLAGMVVVLGALAIPAQGQTLGPDFAADYTVDDLGTVTGVPNNLGGLTLLPGDPNTLIIGGAANGASGALYSIGVVRDMDGHITGFSGTATFFAEAAYNDGGVVFGPGGVLFASRWPVNGLGQYLPGSTTPDKVIDLTPLGVASSNSAINFVPADFGGAGQMKLVSYIGGQFYTATYAPDGMGTFDILSVELEATLPGGPEGFVYVPTGSTAFSGPSMLISEYAAGTVGAYEVDAEGNPIVGTRRDFLTGLTGAEGAFIDPLTGDFLFSTFGGGSRVVAVRGFAVPIPEPTSLALMGIGGVALFGMAARKRHRPH